MQNTKFIHILLADILQNQETEGMKIQYLDEVAMDKALVSTICVNIWFDRMNFYVNEGLKAID